MNPPFDWASFGVLFFGGIVVGAVLWGQLWPIRIAQHIAIPVRLAALVGISTFAIPLFFLNILRWLENEPLPGATTLELMAFAVGAVLGLSIRQWRREPWTI